MKGRIHIGRCCCLGKKPPEPPVGNPICPGRVDVASDAGPADTPPFPTTEANFAPVFDNWKTIVWYGEWVSTLSFPPSVNDPSFPISMVLNPNLNWQISMSGSSVNAGSPGIYAYIGENPPLLVGSVAGQVLNPGDSMQIELVRNDMTSPTTNDMTINYSYNGSQFATTNIPGGWVALNPTTDFCNPSLRMLPEFQFGSPMYNFRYQNCLGSVTYA